MHIDEDGESELIFSEMNLPKKDPGNLGLLFNGIKLSLIPKEQSFIEKYNIEAQDELDRQIKIKNMLDNFFHSWKQFSNEQKSVFSKDQLLQIFLDANNGQEFSVEELYDLKAILYIIVFTDFNSSKK